MKNQLTGLSVAAMLTASAAYADTMLKLVDVVDAEAGPAHTATKRAIFYRRWQGIATYRGIRGKYDQD